VEEPKDSKESKTKREERLQAEVDVLKARLHELEGRVDAMAGGPKHEGDRLRTHIAGFDEALEGGIPRGHVVLIAGPSGTMKTSLALSIVHGNREEGVKGLYVCLEEGRASLLRTMARLGMETKDDFIVDIARLRTEHEAAGETRDWLQILEDYLERRHEKEPFGLVVVDPLNSLYSLARMENPRNDLFRFFMFLRGLGVTAILVAEAEGDASPLPNHEDFLADGAIELRFASNEAGRVALQIRCAKMRHTNHSHDWFYLEHREGGFVARPVGAQ
jgi:circadian clock protein KaiC